MFNRCITSRATRSAIAVALSLSMVLGGVPTSAVQAFADELDEAVGVEQVEEVQPTEEVQPEGEDREGEGEGEEPVEGENVEGENPAENEEGAAEEEAADELTDEDAAGAPEEMLLAAAPGDSIVMKAVGPQPGTITTEDTNALGFVINLYDYVAEDSTTNKYNNDKAGNNACKTGINAGKTWDKNLKFYGTGDGKTTNASNYQSGTNPGNTINQFTGVGKNNNSNNNFYTLQFANQGIVKGTLSGDSSTPYADRYPVVNTNGGGDTQYLFDTNDISGAKTVYSGVNHLFKKVQDDTYGEVLRYDSNQNYAYYDVSAGDGGSFKVYNSTYDRAGGSKSGMKVGFFPFNDWRQGQEPCINPNETRPNNNHDDREYWNDRTAIPHVDHHLGLSMRVPIYMPLNGKLSDGSDMMFSFSGDDDMWVFVDGKLVLDIGGIHQPVSGTINFATGKIELGQGTVNPPIDATERSVNQNGHYSYAASGIQDTNVLGDVNWLWTENGHTGILGDRNSVENRAGSTHTLQVFYLERGGCDSNLAITTNIHRVTPKKADVTKAYVGDGAESTPVEVELVRKGIDNEGGVHYDVIDTQTLNEGNSWSHSWGNLADQGYLSEDPQNPDFNTFCTFTYYVREKSDSAPAGYDALYSGVNGQITPETYTEGENTYLAGASIDDSPLKITNVHTYIDVTKSWLNQAGGPDTASHANDSVWVQLYKQTKSGETWSELEAVGDPQELNNSAWTKRFDISETGENVRYLVKEGTMNGSEFVPATIVYGAKASATDTGEKYSWKQTVYTPKNANLTWSGNTPTITWTNGTASTDTNGGTPVGIVVPAYGSASAVVSNEPVITADLVIQKTDGQTDDPLPGATFVVYKDSGDGTYAKATDAVDAQRFPDAATSFTTAETTGQVTVTELAPGTYWVVETDAPDGYVIRRDIDNPIKVVVNADGTVEQITGTKPDPTLASEGDVHTLTVPNVRAYELPSAGGLGAYPFLTAGSFVAALAAFGIDSRRRSARGERR